jgi:DNA-directed RNA polymerase subunit RPC12/RpoP
MSNREALLNVQITEPRRCPTCAAGVHLTLSFLDPRRGKTVRLYHCAACGERLWDDGSIRLAEVLGGRACSRSQTQ